MMALTPGQLPAPPDKFMYHTDPRAVLNLSTKRASDSDDTMSDVTDSKDDVKLAFEQLTEEMNNADGGQLRVLAPKTSPKPTIPVMEAGAVDLLVSNGFSMEFKAIMGSHGWVITGEEKVKLPYIVRGDGQRLLPLCVVEKTFLAPYPGPYPEKELGRAPMMGFYLTTEEVRLLNRFVNQTYTQRLGLGRFSLKDMLVGASDFVDFYQRVKSMAPYRQTVVTTPETDELLSVQGGWSQVNNTIVPYVMRNRVKMVPLSVVRYASGLLSKVEVPSLEANPEECSYLNDVCSEVGLDFQFEEDTKLIELFLVPTLSDKRVSIKELPKKNPLQHAKFLNRVNDRRSVFVAASVHSQELHKGPRTVKMPSLKSPAKKSPPAPKSSPPQLSTPPKQIVSSPNALTIQPVVTPASLALQQQQVAPDPTVIAQPMPVLQQQQQQQQQHPPGQQIVMHMNHPPPAPLHAMKVCPQHGVRSVLVRQPAPQTSLPLPAGQINIPPGHAVPPGHVILSPAGLQPGFQPVAPNSGTGPTQRHPVLIIRLDKPITPGAPLPIVLPPNMNAPFIVQSPVMPQLVKHEPAAPAAPAIVIKIESDDEDGGDQAQGDGTSQPLLQDISATLLPENKIKTELPDVVDEEVPDRDVVCESYKEDRVQVSDVDIQDNNNEKSGVHNPESVAQVEWSSHCVDEGIDEDIDSGSPAKRARLDSTDTLVILPEEQIDNVEDKPPSVEDDKLPSVDDKLPHLETKLYPMEELSEVSRDNRAPVVKALRSYRFGRAGSTGSSRSSRSSSPEETNATTHI